MTRPTGMAALALAIALAGTELTTGCAGDPEPDLRGQSCTEHLDCGGLSCVADLEAEPEDLTPLPLVCGDARDAGAPGDPCERPEDCARGVCVLAGACASPCEHDEQCDEHERCREVFARTTADALQTVSVCAARADLPPGADFSTSVRSGALEPEVSELELPAAEPQGTTLYVLENLSDNWPDGVTCRPPLCVRALRTRDEPPVELFDAALDYRDAERPLNPVAIGDHLHAAVVMLPIGEAPLPTRRGYTVELAIEQPGTARITRLSGPGGGQSLDLNVFYVGATGLEPEGDRGPPLLADALEVTDDIFAQADIYIGEVRQIAVPGELPLRGTAFPDGGPAQGFATLRLRFGVYVELPHLFRLSAGAANPAIDVFLVAEIEPRTPGAEPEAQAGGIPGPLGMHGTGASGIAISTDMMAGNPTMLGRTLAHEIGHYLGLFHTSEADGTVYEPLSDTPECRLDRDADGDGRLSIAECEGAGTDNLMFWGKTTGTALSEQQRAVLRRALILQ